MQHTQSLSSVRISRGSIVTIGAFDGVHRGHRYLVSRLVERAQQFDMTPVVITFYPHPDVVLKKVETSYYLTLPEEKARLLGALGVDVVVTHPFDDAIRQIRAADFVDDLLKHLKMKALWVGEDFALGYQREGSVTFLQELGRHQGFKVQKIDLMDAGGEQVSSSRIRQRLVGGNVSEANRLLGRPYEVAGEVVEGAKRGQTIGIPTANLSVPAEKLLPSNGVYAVWTNVRGERLPSVTNVGVRPTFDGSASSIHVESHILDFSADIYGESVVLQFLRKLRDEQRFDGVDALVAQIGKDIDHAKAIFSAPEVSGIWQSMD